MSREFETLIPRLALIAFTGVGSLFLLFLSLSVAEDLPLFIDPRFAGFWDDVEAYHLNPQARKTPVELSHKYGNRYVLKYFLSTGLGAAYLPSERAALINTAVYAISEDHKRNRWFVPVVWATMLGGIYGSIVLAARQMQRGLSWLVCRRQEARDLRRAYFAAFEKTGLWRIGAAAGVTLPLAICNAVMLMRPEFRQHGVTVFELTGWLFVLAFFSG